MEDINPSRPGPLLRCVLEGGEPLRLCGEEDVLVLPLGSAIILEAEGTPLDDAGRHTGVRVRLTTHRLLWWVASSGVWLTFRLDQVLGTEERGAAGGLFRSRRLAALVVNFPAGTWVSVAREGENEQRELARGLRAAVLARTWAAGSYQVAALGGLQRILGRRAAEQKAAGDTLDAALGDLQALRVHAAEAVAVAKRVATKVDHASCATGRDDGAGADVAGVRKLLADFGLLAAPSGGGTGSPAVIGTSGGSAADGVRSDVVAVCAAALEKRGGLGMLLVHDAFCLVNRARGTDTLSPADVMAALRASSGSNGQLRLRSLGSTGALAVSLARTRDVDLDAKLQTLADAAPLTAFGLASELGMTAAEAQYLLRDAESRAAIVRDDAPDGVYFYRNFFEGL